MTCDFNFHLGTTTTSVDHRRLYVLSNAVECVSISELVRMTRRRCSSNASISIVRREHSIGSLVLSDIIIIMYGRIKFVLHRYITRGRRHPESPRTSSANSANNPLVI